MSTSGKQSNGKKTRIHGMKKKDFFHIAFAGWGRMITVPWSFLHFLSICFSVRELLNQNCGRKKINPVN